MIQTSDPKGISLTQVLKGHNNPVNEIRWSPDGKTLAASSFDHIYLWDLKSGNLHKDYRNLYSDYYPPLSWSPDGKTIAYDERGKIHFWKIKGLGSISPIFSVSTIKDIDQCDSSVSMIYSHDGTKLFTGSPEKIYFWDLKRLKESTWRGKLDRVMWLALKPDGSCFASGGSEGSLIIWDSKNYEPIRKNRLKNSINCLAWSPNGKYISVGLSDNSIGIWDPSSSEIIHTLKDHTGPVVGVSFSYDSLFLSSKSQDGTIRIWNTDKWVCLCVLNEPHDSNLGSLAFHPFQPILATLSSDKTSIRVWELGKNLITSNM